MARSNPSEHMVEALVRAVHHEEGRHGEHAVPERSPGITIALTRETGARGRTVARTVGQDLAWPVYDHELLEHIAREMKMRVELLEAVDERRRSWLLDSLEALASGPALSESGYVHRLREVLFTLVKKGDCVIVGRGAALILPAATTLRVRLIADKEDRIEVIRMTRSISREAAVRYVDRTDAERVRFNKEHFYKDPADSGNYDIVLNTSRFTLAECSTLIISALHYVQARQAPKASGAGKPAVKSSPSRAKEGQFTI